MSVVPSPRSVLTQAESLDQIMTEHLRRTPWLGLSVLMHGVAILLVMLIPSSKPEPEQRMVTMTRQPDEEVIVEPPPPPDEKPVEEEPEEEPVLQDPELIHEAPEADLADDFSELVVDSMPLSTQPLGLAGRPTGLGHRRKGGREGLGRRGRDTAIAIGEGLEWLRAHQDADGRWDADGFMKHDPSHDVCDGAGNPVHDVGVTALALLAFLGDGSDLRSGPYRDNVKRAVRWLRDQQAESGLFGQNASHDFIYDHTIATLAMAEACGLSQSSILRKYAQRGLNYLESHRNPYMVWGYQPQDNGNDSSVTGWGLMAYKTGRDFGLAVGDQGVKVCEVWFDQVTDPNTGHCGYRKRGELSSRRRGDHAVRYPANKGESMTAVGLASRFFLGQNPKDNPVMLAAADRLLEKPPVWNDADGSIDHYYWYYATYALYQMGGDHWKRWSKHLNKAVVKTRRLDGSYRGSWDPAGVWGEDGGRVYSTAMLVLTLEAYYRYTRVFVR